MKYLVRASDGQLQRKMETDPHPDWQPGEEYIIDIPDELIGEELSFYCWDNKKQKLSVDTYSLNRFRSTKKAKKWMQDGLMSANWGKLSCAEKKLIMRAPLSSQEEDDMLARWVAAGSLE